MTSDHAQTLTIDLLLAKSAAAVTSTTQTYSALQRRSQRTDQQLDPTKSMERLQYLRALRLRHNILELHRQQMPEHFHSAHHGPAISAFITHSFRGHKKQHIRACVQEAANGQHIQPIYGDEDSNVGSARAVLMEKVHMRILEADFYLAILTPSVRNPEAPSAWELVEIGIAIAYQKPIVLLAHASVKAYCMDVFKLYEVPEFDDFKFYDPAEFKKVLGNAFRSAEQLLIAQSIDAARQPRF